MSTLALSALVDESTFTAAGLLAPDLTGQRITGRRVVLEWIVRSWLQPRGRNRLAPNSGVDIRNLENATIDDLEKERWRTALQRTALKAALGYALSVDVPVTHADRTTAVLGRVVLVDGSVDTLAVTIGAVGALVKFGGTL